MNDINDKTIGSKATGPIDKNNYFKHCHYLYAKHEQQGNRAEINTLLLHFHTTVKILVQTAVEIP